MVFRRRACACEGGGVACDPADVPRAPSMRTKKMAGAERPPKQSLSVREAELCGPARAGVGARGSSAVDRLHAAGCVAGAELWALDADRRALDACAAPNALLLEPAQARPGAWGLLQLASAACCAAAARDLRHADPASAPMQRVSGPAQAQRASRKCAGVPGLLCQLACPRLWPAMEQNLPAGVPALPALSCRGRTSRIPGRVPSRMPKVLTPPEDACHM